MQMSHLTCSTYTVFEIVLKWSKLVKKSFEAKKWARTRLTDNSTVFHHNLRRRWILWAFFKGRWLKMKRTWFNIYISAWCRLLWGSILLFWCFRWVFMWWRVAAVLICSGQTHAPHVKSALYPPDSHVSNQKSFFDKRKFLFFHSFVMK